MLIPIQIKTKYFKFFFLFLFIFTLSSCKNYETNTDPEDNNQNQEQTENNDTLLDSSIIQLLESENQFTNIRKVIYFDEDTIVYQGIDDIFYRVKNNILEVHNIFNVNPNDTIGINTPYAIGYDDEKEIIYLSETYISIPSLDSEFNYLAYKLDGTWLDKEIVYGSHTHYIEVNHQGMIVHEGITIEESYFLTTTFEEINLPENSIYLGSKTINDKSNNMYFLFGIQDDNSCVINVYLNTTFEKEIPMTKPCSSMNALDIDNEDIFFLYGEAYGNKNIYHFDLDTLEISLFNFEDGVFDYLVNIDSYRDVYCFRVDDTTYNQVCLNSEMNLAKGVYDKNDIVFIGSNHYIEKDKFSYTVYDMSNTEIEELYIHNPRFKDFNGYTGIAQRGDHVYEYTLYDENFNVFLDNIRALKYLNDDVIVYSQITSNNSFNIIHHDLITDTKTTLQEYNNILDYTWVYNNGIIFTIDDNTFAIVDGNLSNFTTYNIDGTIINSYKLIGNTLNPYQFLVYNDDYSIRIIYVNSIR